MDEAPFELRECRRVEGGVQLVFRCNRCGADTPLVVRDDDPLDGRSLMSCACGAQVNLFFGSPLVGKALLRSIQRSAQPVDPTHRCPSVLLN